MRIKVEIADGEVELIPLKMPKAQAEEAMAAIDKNVESLLAERKRVKREKKQKKKAAEELQGRIDAALENDSLEPDSAEKLLAEAQAMQHVHPSVLQLQAKLKTPMYIRQQPGYEDPGMVVKCLHNMYGSGAAPRIYSEHMDRLPHRSQDDIASQDCRDHRAQGRLRDVAGEVHR